MKRFNVYVALLIVAFTPSAFAFIIDANPSSAKQSTGCIPTASTTVVSEPKEMISNNNLVHKVGVFADKLAQKIILFGRIRDKNCLPVSNAAISVWQTDEYGVYRYVKAVDTSKNIYDMNNQMYSAFEGVGSAISTNTGEFAFVTVHPGKSRGSVDGSVNLVIDHELFPELKTRIVLSDKNQLAKKSHYVVASNTKTLGSNGIKVYYFDIVLDGKNQYLNY